MRRGLLLLGFLGCGCMASIAAEELEALEAEAQPPSLRAMPEMPDDVEVDAPAEDQRPEYGPVRVEVSRYAPDRRDEYDFGTAECPFEIRPVGFPALREDDSEIAILVNELPTGEADSQLVRFEVFDIDTKETVRRETLVEGSPERRKRDCRRWYEKAKAKAKVLNATLAHGWRPMRKLPVEVDLRLDPFHEDDDAEIEEPRPANARPVQLTLQHGKVVFRVRGVKVLARFDDDWWRPEDDDPDEGTCWFHGPNPRAVVVDDETGITLISVEFMGGPCTCDSPISREVVRLGADTIAEIDRLGPFALERAY